MPNWIKNRLTVEKGDIGEILDKNFSEDPKTHQRGFDFETIDKMPDELNIEYGSESEDGLRLYLTKVNPSCKWAGTSGDKLDEKSFAELVKKFRARTFGLVKAEMTEKDAAELQAKYKDRFQAVIDLGKKQFDNLAKYGAMNWYEWHCKHWGCKWNASESSVEGNTIEFQTPWSPAVAAIGELSAQHPNLSLVYEWADEDIGNNVGKAVFANGDVVSCEFYDDCSSKAIEAANKLWGF
jgi:hypothetical protein